MDAISVGGLVVRELVVEGGFSQVWRAWDPLLERDMAVKVFRLDDAKAAELPIPREAWRRRFIAEARLLAGLDHPNLVRVMGFGQLDDGSPYMLMPYYVANLRREIGSDAIAPDEIENLPPLQLPRPVAPRRATEILRQTCLGLAVLHARGCVHRDVKPTNLLTTEREGGDVRLCDLGMAKAAGEEPLPPGVWIGTPDYAAPEQMAAAVNATDRADVYSVGVLGWRLLTGRLPLPDDPPAGAMAGIPPALAPVLDAARAPQPERRPTALQMAAVLSSVEV